MDRLVTGADGREWTIRTQLEWRAPVTAADFEHDVSGGNLPGYLLLGMLGFLVAVLLIWMPDAVVIPAWVPLLLALVLLFFPLRWALRRPWTLVAETDGLESEPRVPDKLSIPSEESEADTDDGTGDVPGEPPDIEAYDPYPAERWVGTVRGMWSVRSHVARTARMIQRHATPDSSGPLRPME